MVSLIGKDSNAQRDEYTKYKCIKNLKPSQFMHNDICNSKESEILSHTLVNKTLIPFVDKWSLHPHCMNGQLQMR